jgi:superfamily II DNA/RNA helicase
MEQLKGIFPKGCDDRIESFSGSTDKKNRERLKHSFNADPSKDPLRIVVCTDATREGLNFQAHCHHLFHFDVPWNPSRMEQRNGRIDRKLQQSPDVYCHYFFYAQRPEDRILQVLVKKTRTIQAELGSLSRVLEERLAGTLANGIRRKTISLMEQQILAIASDPDRQAVVEDELESSRHCTTNIDCAKRGTPPSPKKRSNASPTFSDSASTRQFNIFAFRSPGARAVDG